MEVTEGITLGPDAATAPTAPPSSRGEPESGRAPGSEPARATADGRIAALWLSDASLERLRAAFGGEIGQDLADVQGAAVVVISTRGPRARAIPLARELRGGEPPVVVVSHPGGESVALEIVRAGATAVVAEGNEGAIPSLLEAGPPEDAEEEPLLIAFEQRGGLQRTVPGTIAGSDAVTGLPTDDAFHQRLREADEAGTPARVGLVEVVNVQEAVAGLDPQAREVLRRRLSALLRSLAEPAGAELFALGPWRYAFLARELSADRAQELGLAIVQVARSFTPSGTVPMRVGVGHAGPEVAQDVSMLARLAERALEAAREQTTGAVVNAEHLPTSTMASSELDLALRLVAYLDEHDGYPGSHSQRVAEHAAGLARQLGYEGRDLLRVRLAGLLHDIGKVGLPPEAIHATDELEGEALEAYRRHPERGARYARPGAGPQVAEAIRHHHERWDGSGFPDGLAGEGIPMLARILAVADAYDRLITTPLEDGTAPSPAACLERLRQDAGSAFDPVVIEAAELAFPR